jgi:hypothetical protein
MTFDNWLRHFQTNPDRQRAIEEAADWDSPCTLDQETRHAFIRSFQRFELDEQGDGLHLLDLARKAGDPVYTSALELLVGEEQRHSALFGRGLRHLGATSLPKHWSDAAFTRLRRLLGLRTEIGLFLIVESVALGYFEALATNAPDDVLRAIGTRILTDEVDHVRFQIDRLRQGFASSGLPTRLAVGLAWWVVALGAATVLTIDHGRALRACGLRPSTAWGGALREFRRNALAALAPATSDMLDPTTTSSVPSAPTSRRTRSSLLPSSRI